MQIGAHYIYWQYKVLRAEVLNGAIVQKIRKILGEWTNDFYFPIYFMYHTFVSLSF